MRREIGVHLKATFQFWPMYWCMVCRPHSTSIFPTKGLFCQKLCLSSASAPPCNGISGASIPLQMGADLQAHLGGRARPGRRQSDQSESSTLKTFPPKLSTEFSPHYISQKSLISWLSLDAHWDWKCVNGTVQINISDVSDKVWRQKKWRRGEKRLQGYFWVK